MMLFFQPFIRIWRSIDRNLMLFHPKVTLQYVFWASLSLLFIFFNFAQASTNYFVEEKISESFKQTQESESIVWLKTAEKRDILALHSPSITSELQGGVVILSDLYQTPDSPVIVHGLRTRLPIFGWETLSVQMPVPPSNPSIPQLDSSYDLTRQRIESAINYFKNKNISNIVLIGISHSANFSLKYAASFTAENTKIQAVICIKAFDSSWLTSSDLIKNIAIPILDILPEHDSDVIHKSAEKRLYSAGFAGRLRAKPQTLALSKKVQALATNKTGNLRYRQKIINGANYQFHKQEDTLDKVIRGWMSIYASGTKVTVK